MSVGFFVVRSDLCLFKCAVACGIGSEFFLAFKGGEESGIASADSAAPQRLFSVVARLSDAIFVFGRDVLL